MFICAPLNPFTAIKILSKIFFQSKLWPEQYALIGVGQTDALIPPISFSLAI